MPIEAPGCEMRPRIWVSHSRKAALAVPIGMATFFVVGEAGEAFWNLEGMESDC